MVAGQWLKLVDDCGNLATIPAEQFADVFTIKMLRIEEEGLSPLSNAERRLYAEACLRWDGEERWHALEAMQQVLADDRNAHVGSLLAFMLCENSEADIISEAAGCLLGYLACGQQNFVEIFVNLLSQERLDDLQLAANYRAILRVEQEQARHMLVTLWQKAERSLKNAMLDLLDEEPDVDYLYFVLELLKSPLFVSFRKKIIAKLVYAGEECPLDGVLLYAKIKPGVLQQQTAEPQLVSLEEFVAPFLSAMQQIPSVTAEEYEAVKRAWSEVLP